MRYLSMLIMIATTLLISSCGEEEPIVNTDPEFQVPIVIPNGDENYLNAKSDYIFDQNQLYTYELIIQESELSKLDADPSAEEYVEGSLIFEGDTISPVGIRYKGSVGA